MAIKKPFFVISLPNHLQKYFLEISLFFDTPTVTSKYVTSTSTFTIVRMRNETLFQFKKKKENYANFVTNTEILTAAKMCPSFFFAIPHSALVFSLASWTWQNIAVPSK